MIRSESCLEFLAFTERDEGCGKFGAEGWLGSTFKRIALATVLQREWRRTRVREGDSTIQVRDNNLYQW